MAYKYFSQKLIESNVDLSMVFPEQQSMAKQVQNVTYGLGDIIIYLQDVTNNFKSQDSSYIDLDNAVQQILTRYYKSIGQENPFEQKEVVIDKYEEGVVPSLAVTVKDGKTETAKPIVPKSTQPKVEIKAKDEELLQKIDKFKKTLSNAELLLEDADPQEKEDILNSFRKKLVGIELLMEDLEEGEKVEEFDTIRKDLLTDFIKKNS